MNFQKFKTFSNLLIRSLNLSIYNKLFNYFFLKNFKSYHIVMINRTPSATCLPRNFPANCRSKTPLQPIQLRSGVCRCAPNSQLHSAALPTTLQLSTPFPSETSLGSRSCHLLTIATALNGRMLLFSSGGVDMLISGPQWSDVSAAWNLFTLRERIE